MEAGRPKAEGLFSVKILGFLQTDRAPESIPGPLLQFLPLHSTTEPPHRYCSAPGSSLGSKSNSKAETGAQATRLVSGCACAHRIYGVQQSHCHSYKRVSMEHVESEKLGILL